ncbi:LacI family DNA-binding transcriptional regulator [Amycolatopsis jiangsuensis]|uniref:LacI family transcriptional regulator n=1 Tax=Amycolatopsis jiangsuensis TaxID=1181879 RepID=A0A840J0Z0_9PSEU|nr:LacI family DNA-binding transcriptional regulator [Amycolatopsis jiangsuensis]MBB4688761.1 LacI family transcriptional regulator [Amycolatopsis jiangsuensis]
MPPNGSTGPTGTAAPTMRDVAARAGVSAMTVSRVLKDENVSAATRDRVLTAVRELGYRRNEVARNLRLGRSSGMIGLVVTNLGNPFYSQLALGAEQVAEKHGLRLVLGHTAGLAQREYELVDDLVSRRVDGMIVVPAGSAQQHLDPVSLGGVPVVLASSPPAGIEVDAVLVDDFGGARAATADLLAAGHRAVGFLGNPPTLFTGAERFRGYWAAHEEAGLVPREEWIRRGPDDIPTAAAAARELLDRADPPTALFCTNNRMTLGTYREIRRLGAATALAGFDDFEMADLLDRPITIASYDPGEIGRRAAELLLSRLEQGPNAVPGLTRRLVVPTTLVHYGR